MSVVKKGSTDVSRYIMLTDSADGTPETGVTITGLDLQYTRSGASPAAKQDATALAATNSAHADNKAIEVDGTSSPGLYRVDWPDAAFASGVDKVILVVTGTGLHPAVEEIQLVDYDPEDGTRLGLTALPNAAADANNGLVTGDGTVTFTAGVGGRPSVDATALGGTVQSATDLKDFADSGYDPATNKVQGVVLVDTCTTNTDQRGTDNAALASVCTETRLAELDAANLPADVDGLTTELAKVPKSDGAVSWNATALGAINAQCDTALTDYDGPTNAEMEARTLLAASYFDPSTDTVTTDAASRTASKADVSALALEATVGALNDLSAADVNAQVVDALNVDTYAEPGQGAPAATASLVSKIGYLYKAWRNKTTQTSTTYSLFADDASTVDQKATVSDDNTTATKGEMATGP